MNENKSVTAVFVKDESDEDEDGLTAFAELTQHDTDPNKKDTDGDNINDGDEIGTIFDPTVDDTPTLELLTSNPEFYLGLVLSRSSVFPEIVIKKTKGRDMMITIQIQKTDNLRNWLPMNLQDAEIRGNTITVPVPVSENVPFLRIRNSR